jgi:hypothetical protein
MKILDISELYQCLRKISGQNLLKLNLNLCKIDIDSLQIT